MITPRGSTRILEFLFLFNKIHFKVYEREKQLLIDSREAAVSDRNDALRKNRDLQDKYEDISGSYHSYQTVTNTKLAEIKNTLKLKEFELERINLLYGEVSGKYNESAKENDKIAKKLEVLLDEYNSNRCDHVNEVNTLTLKVRTLQNELSTLKTGDEGIKDLIQILGSENISCNKEHLARKLVELSKNNELLKESLAAKSRVLEKTLRTSEELQSALHHSNQPSSYLVESIKKRDQQISKFKTELLNLSASVKKLGQENKCLLADKEQLTLDLERALKNKEKIADLKSMVEKKMTITDKRQPKPVVFTKK